jgi:hypothetical protein
MEKTAFEFYLQMAKTNKQTINKNLKEGFCLSYQMPGFRT